MPDAPVVLAVNAGSSSVKCGLFVCEGEPQPFSRESLDGPADHAALRIIEWVRRGNVDAPRAVVHRVVHGGTSYREPLRITPAVLVTLRTLIPFAPNHLPEELALIEALGQEWPGASQIACFDTAFHADLPPVARRLPLPNVYDVQGVRRYGFHGLSYMFLLEELGRIAGRAAAHGRLVLAHLGNGSSLAAVSDGTCRDTTMGFTPLGGVVMSTRTGDLDPGVVAYLMRSGSLSVDELEDLLSYRSGLLAISGTTGDMRQLLAQQARDPQSQLAVACYAYAIKKAIGALAAVLGGLDTLVFTGGIGEHAPEVRARSCEGLGHLGIELDLSVNQTNAAVISTADSRVEVRVIPTDEERMMARAACRLLASD